MEKKKVIVTLCKKFPATHPKAGVPTGFESKHTRKPECLQDLKAS